MFSLKLFLHILSIILDIASSILSIIILVLLSKGRKK